MTINPKDVIKSLRPAFDCGKYAQRAMRYAINKFGEVEGNETIVAAMIIAQAIRESSNDLGSHLSSIEISIESLANTIDNNSVEYPLRDIREAIDNLEGTLADAKERL